MSTRSRILCAFYAVIGLGAAVLIPMQNVHYLGMGILEANIKFWTDAMSNPAGASVTIDIVVMYFAACGIMYSEGKRLGMKNIWAYMIGGYLYAIAVSFPLFLMMRERKLAQ